ncbi:IQ domain-containing protein IQM1-like [Diospyros lotus]|uniref:IQ domain-containing protein IQM1-like n=1 Tax=Diospyros lotus TaxID=55363 RepID=UPI0022596621|nr:IQ domain-containing protein IQM1-like [Diospyros lotus]
MSSPLSSSMEILKAKLFGSTENKRGDSDNNSGRRELQITVLDAEKIHLNTRLNEELTHESDTSKSLDELAILSCSSPVGELDAAALRVQKVYRSYQTRRSLADCAVVVEELWWKALDLAAPSLDNEGPESAVSRWSRARTKAAKVGKGLSKDEKAQILALRHWLEAIDPRHRYGHNLHLYYDVWFNSQSSQPFFYWLDVGDGKETNLENCQRTVLQHQCIKYLGPRERRSYEVIIDGGRLVYRQTGVLVDTMEGSKWIFVLSTSRNLYVGQKKKGLFQHSSFLAGGAATAAGRLVARNGLLQAVWPYSGHYCPTEENFMDFISFLEEHNVDMSNVKRCAMDEDVPSGLSAKSTAEPEQGKRASSTTWTTGAGPRIGCVREYPVELQLQALEQMNLSPRDRSRPTGLFPSTTTTTSLPIPSPRPSPRVHLSPRLAHMGLLPSPRLLVSSQRQVKSSSELSWLERWMAAKPWESRLMEEMKTDTSEATPPTTSKKHLDYISGSRSSFSEIDSLKVNKHSNVSTRVFVNPQLSAQFTRSSSDPCSELFHDESTTSGSSTSNSESTPSSSNIQMEGNSYINGPKSPNYMNLTQSIKAKQRVMQHHHSSHSMLAQAIQRTRFPGKTIRLPVGDTWSNAGSGSDLYPPVAFW